MQLFSGGKVRWLMFVSSEIRSSPFASKLAVRVVQLAVEKDSAVLNNSLLSTSPTLESNSTPVAVQHISPESRESVMVGSSPRSVSSDTMRVVPALSSTYAAEL